MSMIISVISVFVLSFLILFIWMYKNEQHGDKEFKIHHLLIAAVFLALVPTLLLALILFTFFGSTTIINSLFGFDISKGSLILISISFVVYTFTLDTLIAMVLEVIIGDNILTRVALFLSRVYAFYAIGMTFGLVQTGSFVIAIVIAILMFAFDYFNIGEMKLQMMKIDKNKSSA